MKLEMSSRFGLKAPQQQRQKGKAEIYTNYCSVKLEGVRSVLGFPPEEGAMGSVWNLPPSYTHSEQQLGPNLGWTWGLPGKTQIRLLGHNGPFLPGSQHMPVTIHHFFLTTAWPSVCHSFSRTNKDMEAQKQAVRRGRAGPSVLGAPSLSSVLGFHSTALVLSPLGLTP